jgi:hypothetical protein
VWQLCFGFVHIMNEIVVTEIAVCFLCFRWWIFNVQTSTLAQLRPLLDCLMDMCTTLPIDTPASDDMDALARYVTCLQPDFQLKLNTIFNEVTKVVNNTTAALVTNSCPAHPLEVALGLSEETAAHPSQITMFQRRVVHELQFVSSDVEVLRQCALSLQRLNKRSINIVEVNLAYGAPQGWFGGDVIITLRDAEAEIDYDGYMIRARFEFLPQLPSISWTNVGWFTQVLSQFRTRQRIAAQLMALLGKEQQVKDVEMRTIVKCKESVEHGLIVHPQFLSRFVKTFRTVQVSALIVCCASLLA